VNDTASEPKRAGHYYIDPAVVEAEELERRAAEAYARTGHRQWIHHHKHGHLCNHRCTVVPTPAADPHSPGIPF
jgi:hypothetical protein